MLDRFYNPEKEEYFFDRNQMSFSAILYFYQSGGIVYIPNTVPKEIHMDELEFFKIPYKGNKPPSPVATLKPTEEENSMSNPSGRKCGGKYGSF